MIIIPIGLCCYLCQELERENERTRRQNTRTVEVRRTRQVINPNVGQMQPPDMTNAEIWSGFFVDGKGIHFPMALWLKFNETRTQFNGGGQENGHNFTIEEGWLLGEAGTGQSVTFTKVVAGHRAAYTGAMDGDRISGTWYLSGYDQTGGTFSLERR